MNHTEETPLVLGGHSFIEQLGNEPRPSQKKQRAIVEACLDQGVRWFDTTYQPERVALGKALASLGRRPDAKILAWNFFTDFKPEDSAYSVGGPDSYQPHHIDLILEQLQTTYLDCLIVHLMNDPEKDARQEELAVSWRQKGYVKSLGLWYWQPDLDGLEHYRTANPYDCVARPCNIASPDVNQAFALFKAMGWETFAVSPFVRGWTLDKMVKTALRTEKEGEAAIRARLADLMLRYTLFHPNVDRLVVSMREPQWVSDNVASISKGPLTGDESDWLDRLKQSSEAN